MGAENLKKDDGEDTDLHLVDNGWGFTPSISGEVSIRGRKDDGLLEDDTDQDTIRTRMNGADEITQKMDKPSGSPESNAITIKVKQDIPPVDLSEQTATDNTIERISGEIKTELFDPIANLEEQQPLLEAIIIENQEKVNSNNAEITVNPLEQKDFKNERAAMIKRISIINETKKSGEPLEDILKRYQEAEALAIEKAKLNAIEDAVTKAEIWVKKNLENKMQEMKRRIIEREEAQQAANQREAERLSKASTDEAPITLRSALEENQPVQTIDSIDSVESKKVLVPLTKVNEITLNLSFLGNKFEITLSGTLEKIYSKIIGLFKKTNRLK